MASEEKSFENVNGRTHGRTDNGRKVITIAHPEQSSGELKTKTKKNNKKKTPASSMTPACAFSMNQSSVQVIHSEGKSRIPVSVACFNYSIAEV